MLKPSESKAQIDGGLVKPIGVFANERLKVMPDVPTFKERGYDVFPYGPLVQMAYIVAPAKTPAGAARLIEIFSKAIQSAEFKEAPSRAAPGRQRDRRRARQGDRQRPVALSTVGKKVFATEKK